MTVGPRRCNAPKETVTPISYPEGPQALADMKRPATGPSDSKSHFHPPQPPTPIPLASCITHLVFISDNTPTTSRSQCQITPKRAAPSRPLANTRTPPTQAHTRALGSGAAPIGPGPPNHRHILHLRGGGARQGPADARCAGASTRRGVEPRPSRPSRLCPGPDRSEPAPRSEHSRGRAAKFCCILQCLPYLLTTRRCIHRIIGSDRARLIDYQKPGARGLELSEGIAS